MSRYFPSAVRAAARVLWDVSNTTKNLESMLQALEQGIVANPDLAKKVDKGVINGDPHPTRHADGSEDPMHLSGVLGKGNLKGSKKATSFHYYPETGDLKFSNSKYPATRINVSNPEGVSSSSTSMGAQVPPYQHASEWEWDEVAQKYRYWDGTQWIWQE